MTLALVALISALPHCSSLPHALIAPLVLSETSSGPARRRAGESEQVGGEQEGLLGPVSCPLPPSCDPAWAWAGVQACNGASRPPPSPRRRCRRRRSAALVLLIFVSCSEAPCLTLPSPLQHSSRSHLPRLVLDSTPRRAQGRRGTQVREQRCAVGFGALSALLPKLIWGPGRRAAPCPSPAATTTADAQQRSFLAALIRHPLDPTWLPAPSFSLPTGAAFQGLRGQRSEAGEPERASRCVSSEGPLTAGPTPSSCDPAWGWQANSGPPRQPGTALPRPAAAGADRSRRSAALVRHAPQPP